MARSCNNVNINNSENVMQISLQKKKLKCNIIKALLIRTRATTNGALASKTTTAIRYSI